MECISPISLKDSGVTVPCGKCHPCKSKRVSGWSFRLLKEAEVSSSAFFVTLTYDNDHCPTTDNGFMTLKKSDIQGFFKVLRRANKEKLKYYVAGEYGGKYGRPHYHIILFNATLESLIGKAYANMHRMGVLDLDGKQQYDCNYWDKGHITVGKLSPASAGYTLKYVSKETNVGVHKRDDRLPEFSLMSKKMGANYVSQAMKEWHLSDILNRMYVQVDERLKIGMPRYYKKKIYTDWQRLRISGAVHEKRVEEFNKKSAKQKLIDTQRETNRRKHFSRLNGKDDRNLSIE